MGLRCRRCGAMGCACDDTENSRSPTNQNQIDTPAIVNDEGEVVADTPKEHTRKMAIIAATKGKA